MKKILTYLSTALILFIGFSACDEDETTYKALEFPQDSFVAFDLSAIEAPESSIDPIEIVVTYAHSIQETEAVSVNYTITSDAVEGTHYTIVDGKTSFDFASGVYSDTLEILPIDNLDEDGTKELIITLEGSSVDVGLPGPDSFNKTITVSLLDDDCAFVPASFAGLPEGEELGVYGGPYASEAKFTLVEETATTATFSVEGLYAGQFAAWGETVQLGGSILVTLDNTDPLNPTVTMQGSEDPYGLGRNDFYAETGADGWGYFFNIDTTATNTFSTCGSTLTFTYWIDMRSPAGAEYPFEDRSVITLQY